MNEAWTSKTAAELEEKFLNDLETEPLPFKNLLDAANALAMAGSADQAESCVELLTEKLVASRDVSGLMRLFEAASEWQADDEAFRNKAARALVKAFGDRMGEVLVKNAGFGKSLSFRAAFDRLRLFTGLKPGQYCQDKTWGFGVVDRVDNFYEKIVINFLKKPGHTMTLAYAAEALELVTADHLLARWHRDPAALQELIRTDPAEVVRIALRSFGPMNVPSLQERLTERLIPAADWKKFWDSARKALKDDPLVEIPFKRAEPARLLDKPRDYGDAWFAAFRGTTDPEKILALVGELEARSDCSALDEAETQALAERLAFVVHAADGRQPALFARAALTVARLGLGAGAGPDRAAATLLEPANLLRAASNLPARDVRRLFDYLALHDRTGTLDALLAILPDMTLGALGDAVDFLVAGGRESEVTTRLRGLLETQSAGVVALCWAAKRLDMVVNERRLAPPGSLLTSMVEALNEQVGGERLRAQNRLRAMFEDRAWLARALDGTTPLAREDILGRIHGAQGWDLSSRRLAMAAMIKLYPELARVVASQPEENAAGKRGRYTSARSYRQRVEQHKRLVEVEIPQNIRDIAQARSYGDLRENAEYETARHQQRLLARRQAEMERELGEVRPTDFSGFQTDRAGMGAAVAVRRPDGRVARYMILGEWDQDDALGILSSGSRIAEILDGRRVGDTVELPGALGDEPCAIVEIAAVPDEIRRWIAG
ncbi:MAG: GreA/GreB family elongation factor [Verrucomicrobiota bacterium]|nr:GreA/GreB family elongation factor [Verrucomicrobiota bacterium]